MAESEREIRLAPVKERKRRSLIADIFIRLIREKPLGAVGGVIVILLVLLAILADVIAPYGMTEMNFLARLSPPSPEHIMGADHLGRDLFSRIVFGARISLYVGLISTSIGTAMATVIGLISGFLGGKTDMIIQRIIDGLLCFPAMVVALTVIAIVGAGLSQVIIVLGFTFGYRWTRVVRSAVIGIKENVYVEAARATGVPVHRILIKHILPNVLPVVIVIFTVVMGQAILIEAVLSFLGFGVPPPQPSWGGMLSGIGRRYLLQAPWIALWPGLFLAVVVYGINMLGDALRDILDPRMRGGLGRYSGVKRRIPKMSAEG